MDLVQQILNILKIIDTFEGEIKKTDEQDVKENLKKQLKTQYKLLQEKIIEHRKLRRHWTCEDLQEPYKAAQKALEYAKGQYNDSHYDQKRGKAFLKKLQQIVYTEPTDHPKELQDTVKDINEFARAEGDFSGRQKAIQNEEKFVELQLKKSNWHLIHAQLFIEESLKLQTVQRNLEEAIGNLNDARQQCEKNALAAYKEIKPKDLIANKKAINASQKAPTYLPKKVTQAPQVITDISHENYNLKENIEKLEVFIADNKSERYSTAHTTKPEIGGKTVLTPEATAVEKHIFYQKQMIAIQVQIDDLHQKKQQITDEIVVLNKTIKSSEYMADAHLSVVQNHCNIIRRNKEALVNESRTPAEKFQKAHASMSEKVNGYKKFVGELNNTKKTTPHSHLTYFKFADPAKGEKFQQHMTAVESHASQGSITVQSFQDIDKPVLYTAGVTPEEFKALALANPDSDISKAQAYCQDYNQQAKHALEQNNFLRVKIINGRVQSQEDFNKYSNPEPRTKELLKQKAATQQKLAENYKTVVIKQQVGPTLGFTDETVFKVSLERPVPADTSDVKKSTDLASIKVNAHLESRSLFPIDDFERNTNIEPRPYIGDLYFGKDADGKSYRIIKDNSIEAKALEVARLTLQDQLAKIDAELKELNGTDYNKKPFTASEGNHKTIEIDQKIISQAKGKSVKGKLLGDIYQHFIKAKKAYYQSLNHALNSEYNPDKNIEKSQHHRANMMSARMDMYALKKSMDIANSLDLKTSMSAYEFFDFLGKQYDPAKAEADKVEALYKSTSPLEITQKQKARLKRTRNTASILRQIKFMAFPKQYVEARQTELDYQEYPYKKPNFIIAGKNKILAIFGNFSQLNKLKNQITKDGIQVEHVPIKEVKPGQTFDDTLRGHIADDIQFAKKILNTTGQHLEKISDVEGATPNTLHLKHQELHDIVETLDKTPPKMTDQDAKNFVKALHKFDTSQDTIKKGMQSIMDQVGQQQSKLDVPIKNIPLAMLIDYYSDKARESIEHAKETTEDQKKQYNENIARHQDRTNPNRNLRTILDDYKSNVAKKLKGSQHTSLHPNSDVLAPQFGLTPKDHIQNELHAWKNAAKSLGQDLNSILTDTKTLSRELMTLYQETQATKAHAQKQQNTYKALHTPIDFKNARNVHDHHKTAFHHLVKNPYQKAVKTTALIGKIRFLNSMRLQAQTAYLKKFGTAEEQAYLPNLSQTSEDSFERWFLYYTGFDNAQKLKLFHEISMETAAIVKQYGTKAGKEFAQKRFMQITKKSMRSRLLANAAVMMGKHMPKLVTGESALVLSKGLGRSAVICNALMRYVLGWLGIATLAAEIANNQEGVEQALVQAHRTSDKTIRQFNKAYSQVAKYELSDSEVFASTFVAQFTKTYEKFMDHPVVNEASTGEVNRELYKSTIQNFDAICAFTRDYVSPVVNTLWSILNIPFTIAYKTGELPFKTIKAYVDFITQELKFDALTEEKRGKAYNELDILNQHKEADQEKKANLPVNSLTYSEWLDLFRKLHPTIKEGSEFVTYGYNENGKLVKRLITIKDLYELKYDLVKTRVIQEIKVKNSETPNQSTYDPMKNDYYDDVHYLVGNSLHNESLEFTNEASLAKHLREHANYLFLSLSEYDQGKLRSNPKIDTQNLTARTGFTSITDYMNPTNKFDDTWHPWDVRSRLEDADYIAQTEPALHKQLNPNPSLKSDIWFETRRQLVKAGVNNAHYVKIHFDKHHRINRFEELTQQDLALKNLAESLFITPTGKNKSGQVTYKLVDLQGQETAEFTINTLEAVFQQYGLQGEIFYAHQQDKIAEFPEISQGFEALSVDYSALKKHTDKTYTSQLYSGKSFAGEVTLLHEGQEQIFYSPKRKSFEIRYFDDPKRANAAVTLLKANGQFIPTITSFGHNIKVEKSEKPVSYGHMNFAILSKPTPEFSKENYDFTMSYKPKSAKKVTLETPNIPYFTKQNK